MFVTKIKYINKSLSLHLLIKRIYLAYPMLSIKGHNIISNTDPTNQSRQTTRITNKPPLPKKKKTVKVLKHDYVSDERKENILNAKFNRKKQQLFEITRENVRLFQKINSQKSIYSHQSLHKSYESNKSLKNSRMSQRSQKSLQKSRISNCSKTSQKSNTNQKNKFFNRATSAKSTQNKPSSNKIIIKDVKRKSMVNLKPKGIQQTVQEDIQQFAGLFNIKEEPTGKERNRPVRIRSTNNLRSLKTMPSQSFNGERKLSQPKQIVINEENQIQIHEEIQAEDWDTFRAKSSRAKSSRAKQLSIHQKIPQQISENAVLEDDTKINIIPCQTEQCLKSSKRSQASQHSASSHKFSRQNIENLFQIKNSGIRSRLEKKIGNEKVSVKYANLLSKINTELNKHVKKPKQTSIYPFKSRLIA